MCWFPRLARPALALLCGLWGCGTNTSLSGSVGDVVSLAYDRVAYYSDGSSLNIAYKKGTDLVCKLVIDAVHSGAKSGVTLSGGDFLKYVQISRVTAKGDAFAATTSGQIVLTHFSLASNSAVSGSFNALFQDGNLILGTFDGVVANP